MSILKCKYCGGAVTPFPGKDMGICGTCGSTVTLPHGEDPRRLASHNAGSHFRQMGNFEKALSIYQTLADQDATDAEAHWGCALSRFGIVYENDTGEFAPHCRIPAPGSFLLDAGYLAALANAEGDVRLQYEQDAAKIESLLTPVSPAVEEIPTEAILPEEPTAEETAPIVEDPEMLLKKAFRNLELGSWAEAEALAQQSIQADGENALPYLAGLMAQLHCRKPADLANCTSAFDETENYRKALQYADPGLKNTLIQCAEQASKRMQRAKVTEFYNSAVTRMELAVTEAEYREAAGLFARLSHYQDADQRHKTCLLRAEEIRKDTIYDNAMALARSAKTKAQWEEVLSLFASISGWKDADEKIANCKQQCKQAAATQGVRAKAMKGLRIVVGLTGTALLLGVGTYFYITKYYIPQGKYDAAERHLAANDKEAAIVAFQELGDYRDSQDRAAQIQADWYEEAETLLAHSDNRRAAIAFGGMGDYSDARERSLELWEDIVDLPTFCGGGWYTAGLYSNGMAAAVGDNQEKQLEVGGWLNIRSISAGWNHTVGLRTDGTAVAAGFNGDGRCDVDSWRNLVSICAGQWHTVGLRNDGKPIGVGCSEDGRIDFTNWRDIVAISAGRNHTLGLRADNTVVAAGRNDEKQCDITDWYAIRSIAAGGSHSVGLKMDGTVVAVGCNEDGQCQVGTWTDITAIAAGYYHTVGLKSDGTVVAVGLDYDMQCQVKDWTDIVAIAAGGWHTIGMKADGTIVCTGRNVNGQCDTGEWSNLMLPTR